MKVGLQRLRHSYGPRATGRAALAIDALQVEPESALCLVGSSGSGKTTLLNILAGVLVPSSGQVQIAEQDLFALSEADRDRFRARHIGCVFQTLNLLQGLSVLENLTLAQRFAGIGATEALRKGRELLEQLGLAERARARPAQLSLGEQQRVAIARAVCKSPGLVLADEPTASLDDQNAQAAVELLLQSCQHSTLIVASHDARVIGRFERVVSLAQLASGAQG
ncbi:MAG: ABC transporter ATP-binding protein [Deltaproteobacteria bacterium]